MLEQANADDLSRLPWDEGYLEGHYGELGIFNISQLDCLSVTSIELKTCTSTDNVLSKVLLYMKEGWPQQVDDRVKPYMKCRDGISKEVVVYFGSIRASYLRSVIQQLHKGRP